MVVLVKIAAGLNDACHAREDLGAPAGLEVRTLAGAADWVVDDVLCTHRVHDPVFEERHDRYKVALVGAGTFHCRTAAGRELLTPGALLLGNAHERFECGHEHGSGDRCLAFGYSAESFEQLAFEVGVRGRPRLRSIRIPPLDALAPLVAETCGIWASDSRALAVEDWEEVSVRIAAAAARLAGEPSREPRAPRGAEIGIARAVRLIERDPAAPIALRELAQEANLSRFHFVRVFKRVTGLTPHRYLSRARLRHAAVRLATADSQVIDIALDCGYCDVSNFNHAFRAEFHTTPLEHRARLRRRHRTRPIER